MDKKDKKKVKDILGNSTILPFYKKKMANPKISIIHTSVL